MITTRNILKIEKGELFNLTPKDLITLYYFFTKSDKENELRFTYSDIKNYYGYNISNKHTNTVFKKSIDSLIKRKYISEINKNQYLYSKKEPLSNYIMFETEEFNKIKQYESEGHKINWENVLYVYIIIKYFINMSMELKYCFLSYEKISLLTNLSEKTIRNTVQIIHDIGLFKIYDFGFYRTKKGTLKKSSNVYVIEGDVKKIKADYELTLGGKFI